MECHLPRLGVDGSQADLLTESPDAMSSPPPFCSPETCLPQASRRLPTPVWYSRLPGTVCDEALSLHPSHSLDRRGCAVTVCLVLSWLWDHRERGPIPFPSCSPGSCWVVTQMKTRRPRGTRYHHGASDRAPQTFSYALHVFSDGEPLNV